MNARQVAMFAALPSPQVAMLSLPTTSAMNR